MRDTLIALAAAAAAMPIGWLVGWLVSRREAARLRRELEDTQRRAYETARSLLRARGDDDERDRLAGLAEREAWDGARVVTTPAPPPLHWVEVGMEDEP